MHSKFLGLLCGYAYVLTQAAPASIPATGPPQAEWPRKVADTAPFNVTLANYKLPSQKGPSPSLSHGYFQTSCGSNLSFHYTDPSLWAGAAGSASLPVLVLTHGYPESSYEWRELTGPLSARVPLFVPDQPGYGLSTPCTTSSSKVAFASAILEALASIYPNSTGPHVILAGHDRGARVMYRAAMSLAYPSSPYRLSTAASRVQPLGLFIADIVPLPRQFAAFTDPTAAVGYFHWSLLPRGAFATDMILAYGGGRFARYLIEGLAGNNSDAAAKLYAGNALDVYSNFFDQASVTNATVFDYQAGATVDYDAEVEDQKAGRKVGVPTVMVYSEANLGETFGDLEGVWRDQVQEGALQIRGVGGGVGHFLVEEAPEETVGMLNDFLNQLQVAAQ